MASSMKGFEHLEIQLEEIKSATNNFDEENVIGNGGFGKVYKGELSHSHSTGKSMVALKRLDRRHGQGDAEFHKEVRMLSCYRHENIISLLGFSSGRDEMILVYEYASRGSLDSHLKDATLTWTQRIKVCLDAAKGLCYLHDPRESYQRLIHCDIKSANILLDENFKAKVSDFGLSKIGPANQQNSILVTGALGTPGYCDPVFMERYTLTKESDVYSFGVVLYEVLCGKLCVEYSKGHLKVIHVPMWKQSYEQKQLSRIVFHGLMEQMNPDSLETFSGIAYQCLKRFREERPAMSLVVEKLQESLALQERHDLKLLKEYEDIINAAVPPLNYTSLDELNVILPEGFHVSEGTMHNANQMDTKKQFQLDLDKIAKGEDTRTTLMIKNIPNKYTSKMLLASIEENHSGTYDFLYLPIDFKNKCNVGYAFINMLSPMHIVPFCQVFNGKKWEKFNSEKLASLAYARIQGKAALVTHLQNSSLMNEDK